MPSLTIDPVAGSALSRSNPFPGLRPYEEPDAEWFFGRGAEINDLLKRLRRLHFVAIVGASGCGKSSLIRAGVLPHIRDGYLDAEWSIAAFRPGERPLANLAEALCPELSCDLEAFTDTLHSGSLGLVKAVQSANPPARQQGAEFSSISSKSSSNSRSARATVLRKRSSSSSNCCCLLRPPTTLKSMLSSRCGWSG